MLDEHSVTLATYLTELEENDEFASKMAAAFHHKADLLMSEGREILQAERTAGLKPFEANIEMKQRELIARHISRMAAMYEARAQRTSERRKRVSKRLDLGIHISA